MNKNISAFFLIMLVLLFLSSCEFLSFEKKEIETEELSAGVDGVQKKYRKDKSLLTTIEYKDNKRHGISRLYYEDGKTVHNEICYNMGAKNGITNSYYRSGHLYYTVKYVNGKREGILRKYYETGKIMAEVPYVKSEARPGLIEYQKTGEKKKIYPKLIFEEIDKTAFENKYIVRIRFSGGKKNVKFYKTMYDTNGDEFAEKRLITEDGVAENVFYIYKDGYIDEKFKIRAVYTTISRNPYVVYKTKHIKVEW